jgi:hypothetical protein
LSYVTKSQFFSLQRLERTFSPDFLELDVLESEIAISVSRSVTEEESSARMASRSAFALFLHGELQSPACCELQRDV